MTERKAENSQAPTANEAPVVALLSGGVDSAVMVGLALERGARVTPLYVRQGFLWEIDEVTAVRRFLDSLRARGLGDRLEALEQVTIGAPRSFAARWALDAEAPPPDEASADEAVMLPGRNLALLGQAALVAHSVGANRVQIGLLAGNPFPDAGREFLRHFERAATAGLGAAMRVETPLAHLTKTEVLEIGARFELQWTLSCIRPKGGAHCGACNKCAERRRAFARAGLPDRTIYAVAAGAAS